MEKYGIEAEISIDKRFHMDIQYVRCGEPLSGRIAVLCCVIENTLRGLNCGEVKIVSFTREKNHGTEKRGVETKVIQNH